MCSLLPSVFFFRCWDRKIPDNHATSYARHRSVAREQNVEGTDDNFLVCNEKHYVLGSADYAVLSKEKSIEFFKKKEQKENKAPTPQTRAETLSPLPAVVTSFIGDFSQVYGPEVSQILDYRPNLEMQEEPLNLTVNTGPTPVEDLLEQLLTQEETIMDKAAEGSAPKRPTTTTPKTPIRDL